MTPKDRANPISMILTAAMMLEWLREGEAARRVHAEVDAALNDQAITIRPDGTLAAGTLAAGTRAAARAVVERLR